MRRALILLALGGVLAGCQSLEKLEHAERATAPTEVRVGLVQEGSLPEEFVTSAQIRATRRATVSAQTEGMVERVAPEMGDRVQEGEALIWLRRSIGEMQLKEQEADVTAARSRVQEQQVGVRLAQQNMENDLARAKEGVTQAEIAVAQAKTELDSAKNDYDRKRGLLEEKAIAETQVEKAKLQWDLAEDGLRTAESKLSSARSDLTLARSGTTKVDLQRAQLRSAEAELERALATTATSRSGLEESVLKAPISGVVTVREVSPGQSVSPAQGALLTIVDNSRLEIQAQVDQQYAPHLRRGMLATVSSQLYAEKRWEVRLREVVPASNPETSTLGVRFEFVGETPGMVDGTTIQLRIGLEEKRGVLVPLQAVVSSKLGQHVLLVKDGKSLPKAIAPIAQDESHVLLVPGTLPAGEQVVVEGLNTLVETPVKILPARQSGK